MFVVSLACDIKHQRRIMFSESDPSNLTIARFADLVV